MLAFLQGILHSRQCCVNRSQAYLYLFLVLSLKLASSILAVTLDKVSDLESPTEMFSSTTDVFDSPVEKSSCVRVVESCGLSSRVRVLSGTKPGWTSPELLVCLWPCLYAIFFVTLVIMLKGGNIYRVEWSHVRLKASIAIASGSGCQLTYLSICLLILLANKSISGVYAISQIFLNKSGFNIHSVFTWKTYMENPRKVVRNAIMLTRNESCRNPKFFRYNINPRFS